MPRLRQAFEKQRNEGNPVMRTWLSSNAVGLMCRLGGACVGAALCALITNKPLWIAAVVSAALGAFGGQLVAAHISRPKN